VASVFHVVVSSQITNVLTGDRIKLIELCDAWVEAVGSRSLLGGNEPNMADLAVYGALSR